VGAARQRARRPPTQAPCQAARVTLLTLFPLQRGLSGSPSTPRWVRRHPRCDRRRPRWGGPRPRWDRRHPRWVEHPPRWVDGGAFSAPFVARVPALPDHSLARYDSGPGPPLPPFVARGANPMKPPKVLINGVDLSRVTTPKLSLGRSASTVRVGRPLAGVRDDDASLVLEVCPLTLAQLYFDGVLPQDRDVPVEVRGGRRKPSQWRVQSLEMQENRWTKRVGRGKRTSELIIRYKFDPTETTAILTRCPVSRSQHHLVRRRQDHAEHAPDPLQGIVFRRGRTSRIPRGGALRDVDNDGVVGLGRLWETSSRKDQPQPAREPTSRWAGPCCR